MSKILSSVLSQYGYNLVALPTTSCEPLLLLFRKNDHLRPVGAPLTKLFKAGDAAQPETTSNVKVMDISDSVSLAINAGVGVSLAEKWVRQLSNVTLHSGINVNEDDEAIITYRNITQDRVDLLALDEFINKGDPLIDNFKSFADKLFEGELFVVDTVLKSNRFSVSISDKDTFKLDTAVSVSSGIGVDVKTERDKEKKVLLEYEGDVPLVFAFKAQKIIYDAPKWWKFWDKGEAHFRIREQSGEVLMDEAGIPTHALRLDGEMFEW